MKKGRKRQGKSRVQENLRPEKENGSGHKGEKLKAAVGKEYGSHVQRGKTCSGVAEGYWGKEEAYRRIYYQLSVNGRLSS